MRFMIGLLVGAALVLTLVTRLGLQPAQIADGLRAQGSLTEPVSEASGHEPAGLSEWLPSQLAAAAEQRLASGPIKSDQPTVEPAAKAEADQPLSNEPEVSASAVAKQDSGWQSVWTPFYSQLSAEGFARRLADTTARPFAVRKEAAGRYQVVFAYADEDERARMLEAFAAATGAEAP